MKVNDDLYVLPVTVELPTVTMVINLSLIVDPIHGPTLVDTGFPAREQAVIAALEADGFGVEDIRQIVITHQDLDHIGGLAALKSLSDATIYAHHVEAPYIDGRTRIVKYPSEERFNSTPGLREVWDSMQYQEVDKLVEDGDRLDFAANAQVVFTPGHTPGHISLYLDRTKTLITGDALVATENRLQGPNPGATPDMPTALKSVQKLANLPAVETIVCYHGGLVTEDAMNQLRRVSTSG